MTFIERMMSRSKTVFVLSVAGISLLTVLFYSLVMDISRDYPNSFAEARVDSSLTSKPIVRIGVISRYPATVIYRGYQPMMDYLSMHTPYRFELLLSRDYAEALHQLVTKKATAVFLGSYQYVKAHDRYRIIPVLKPLNENGEPSSRSVLIVRSKSRISGINDLRGRRLALPSAESFSANWLVGHEFPLNGLAPTDLAEIRYFPHHQTVIYQVLGGRFDAGVTREYLIRDLLEDQVRAVRYSDPIPSSPLAVSADHDTAVVGALTRALLAVAANEERRAAITRDWDGEFVHGFVTARDNDYDAVRKISHIR